MDYLITFVSEIIMIIIIIAFVFKDTKTGKRFWKKIKKTLKYYSKNILNEIYQLTVLVVNSIYEYLLNIIKGLKYHIKYSHIKELDKLKNAILNMEPREFEEFSAMVYRRLNYKVELTSEGCDYGRDIIIEKDGKVLFVECKRWSQKTGHQVGREICQKLIGSCAAFNVERAIIINTGDYHENAYEYAERLNRVGKYSLTLLTIDDLIELYFNQF